MVNLISKLRREYGTNSLAEANLPVNPLDLFDAWFQEALASKGLDANAMVLSTVDEQGNPDARIVLLKGIVAEKFLFYTNYDSAKGQQINCCPRVALTFYWPEHARQVRIRGVAQKISEAESLEYFNSRPLRAQLGAIFSPQSKVIKGREELEAPVEHWLQVHPEEAPSKPQYWGGYAIAVENIEFWQGRDNRLHDRIQYLRKAEHNWTHQRLAP